MSDESSYDFDEFEGGEGDDVGSDGGDESLTMDFLENAQARPSPAELRRMLTPPIQEIKQATECNWPRTFSMGDRANQGQESLLRINQVAAAPLEVPTTYQATSGDGIKAEAETGIAGMRGEAEGRMSDSAEVQNDAHQPEPSKNNAAQPTVDLPDLSAELISEMRRQQEAKSQSLNSRGSVSSPHHLSLSKQDPSPISGTSSLSSLFSSASRRSSPAAPSSVSLSPSPRPVTSTPLTPPLKSTQPFPGSVAAPPTSHVPTALDRQVLRLILHITLANRSGRGQASASTVPTRPAPHITVLLRPRRPYLLGPRYIANQSNRAGTAGPVSFLPSEPEPTVRGSKPNASILSHSQTQRHHAAVRSANQPSYIDQARHQRAKVLALAGQIAGPPEPCAVLQPAVRSRWESTAEETRAFQECYAAFIARLSRLTQEACRAEPDPNINAELHGRAQLHLSYASALSASIKEILSDSVVINLIRQATLSRLRLLRACRRRGNGQVKMGREV